MPPLMNVNAGHQAELRSTNRLHNEVKRRSDQVGIFPDEGVIVRLIGTAQSNADDNGSFSNDTLRPSR